MNPGDLLRAVRRSRHLSQRELADLAAVPQSSVDRIESGASARPSLALLEKILRPAGYELTVINGRGRLLQIEDSRFRPLDRANRLYPAHLELRRVRNMDDPWWGWHNIAFSDRDPNRPDWTFDRGPIRKYPPDPDRRWDSAT